MRVCSTHASHLLQAVEKAATATAAATAMRANFFIKKIKNIIVVGCNFHTRFLHFFSSFTTLADRIQWIGEATATAYAYSIDGVHLAAMCGVRSANITTNHHLLPYGVNGKSL